jgi:SAM-dependent methyltransferase
MAQLIPRIEFGVQALFRRQRSCPYCGGGEHAIVARKYGVIRVRHCQDCFLYFTDPIYRSQLGDFYNSLYRAEGLTTTLPDSKMLADLRASNFANTGKDATATIQALMRLSPGRALLEIGSSWGYFLYQARAVGFSAVGIEPARTRREFGVRELGIDIRECLTDVGDARFDVIYCAHTLEHMLDVGSFFSDCYSHLREGGLLVIEVPHFDLEALGTGVLSIIGAVHPLGLSRPFFKQALPRERFRLVGMYDRWVSVPSTPMGGSLEGVLIVVAAKMAQPQ